MSYQPVAQPSAQGGGSNRTIIIIVIVVLVLCCCCATLGIGYYLYINGDQLFKTLVPTPAPALLLKLLA